MPVTLGDTLCFRCLPISALLWDEVPCPLLRRIIVHSFILGTLKIIAVVGLDLPFMGHKRAENKRPRGLVNLKLLPF